VREFALLEYLMRTPGRVHTRTQLCEHVWTTISIPARTSSTSAVQRLRRKIDDGHTVPLVHTVRGVGYT